MLPISTWTATELNITIAELHGWTVDDEPEDGAIMGTSPDGAWDMIPNYLSDDKAYAEIEKECAPGKPLRGLLSNLCEQLPHLGGDPRRYQVEMYLKALILYNDSRLAWWNHVPMTE